MLFPRSRNKCCFIFCLDTPYLFPQTRGSSSSPIAPHSQGFWLQHPDDIHQTWVRTKTPPSEGPSGGDSSTFTWPRRMKTAVPGEDQGTSREGETGATLPRIYKSQALWVSKQLFCYLLSANLFSRPF